MVKFLSVVGIAAFLLVTLSFVWPRMTPNPRPEGLNRIYRALVQTSQGQQIAIRFGVYDEGAITQFSLQRMIGGIREAIRARINDVVMTHTIRSLRDGLHRLPREDQVRLLESLAPDVAGEATSSPSQEVSHSTK